MANGKMVPFGHDSSAKPSGIATAAALANMRKAYFYASVILYESGAAHAPTPHTAQKKTQTLALMSYFKLDKIRIHRASIETSEASP